MHLLGLGDTFLRFSSYFTGSPQRQLQIHGEFSACASGPVTIPWAIDTGWFETKRFKRLERIPLQGPVISEDSMSSSPFGLPAALGKKSLGEMS